jgi:telomerase Cajal body protein 1
MESHSGGLTHLMFSKDGNKLFSGGRKDSSIYCWDIRNPGKILQVFKRDVKTNQRIYFDLNDDKYLCSGNNNGMVSIWNANDFDLSLESEPELYAFKASDDCINGVSFNLQYSLLATSTGQRKFFFNNYKNINDSSSSDSDDENENELTYENCLKIWKYNL